jgi:hypothetical protein
MFNDVVEIFDLADLDSLVMVGVVADDHSRGGAAFVDRDLLRNTMTTDGLAQEAQRRDVSSTTESVIIYEPPSTERMKPSSSVSLNGLLRYATIPACDALALSPSFGKAVMRMVGIGVPASTRRL